MRTREDEGKRRRGHDPAVRRAEPTPVESVLDLQRSAGNRAVSAMLGREPTDTGGVEAQPMKEEKG